MRRLFIVLAVVVVCAAVIADVTAGPLLMKVLVTIAALGFAGLVARFVLADRSRQ
jgi:hypothetical protein